MSTKRARLYDVFALITVMIVILLDQWTKQLVVKRFRLGDVVPFPILGHNVVFEYTQNSGAAFSMLKGNALLALFIMIAVGVVGYLYSRIWQTGSLISKLIFGLIIGGALGNLFDRVIHGGFVVDFISFRLPEIGFYFAIFNVADACISIGVALLFILVLFDGLVRTNGATKKHDTAHQSTASQEPTYPVNQEEIS